MTRVAAGWLVLVVIAALAAPLLAPHDPATTDLANVLAGPTGGHPLGTDALGQDVLSRLLYGARPTLAGVVAALVTFLALGVPFGLAAGYVGGLADRAIMRSADLLIALPHVIILLAVLAILDESQLAAMLALGILSAPGVARIARSATLSVRHEQYIAAAKVSGLGELAILRTHVLPRIVGPIFVQAALFAAIALLVQTGLNFLGAGPPPPDATWGGSISDAASVIDTHPWLIFPTGGAVFLTILSLGVLGSALRDRATRSWSPAQRGRPVARPSAHDPGVLLRVEGLSVAFGPTAVVQTVSFEIDDGEAVALLGESGSGKTLTARALLGLVPATGRTAGVSRFDGTDLLALDDRALRGVRGRQIGFVAQEPALSLDPTFTVGSVVSEAVRHHLGFDRRAAKARSVRLLARVGLPEAAADRRPGELSGGMAQRAAIALALAGEPRLLIADEPTSALDADARDGILALLAGLRENTGMALFLITHDWGVAAQACERAMVMYAGQIVEQSPLDALLAEPLHPYTQGLLAARPGRHTRGRPLPVISGTVPLPAQWPPSCHFGDRCWLATSECRQGPIALGTPRSGRLSRCIHVDRLHG